MRSVGSHAWDIKPTDPSLFHGRRPKPNAVLVVEITVRWVDVWDLRSSHPMWWLIPLNSIWICIWHPFLYMRITVQKSANKSYHQTIKDVGSWFDIPTFQPFNFNIYQTIILPSCFRPWNWIHVSPQYARGKRRNGPCEPRNTPAAWFSELKITHDQYI